MEVWWLENFYIPINIRIKVDVTRTRTHGTHVHVLIDMVHPLESVNRPVRSMRPCSWTRPRSFGWS